MAMTLYEMSFLYREDVLRLRMRITALREQARGAGTEDEARALRRRVAALEPLVRQSRELAELTCHYYERSYHRNEKYTV